jgi:hypothetical protein
MSTRNAHGNGHVYLRHEGHQDHATTAKERVRGLTLSELRSRLTSSADAGEARCDTP